MRPIHLRVLLGGRRGHEEVRGGAIHTLTLLGASQGRAPLRPICPGAH